MSQIVPARRRQWLVAALVIIIAAFVIRAILFGNPLIDVDEDFYLLVGDRVLHGAIPYVDIWDRKPVGLFLIYAGIRLLGGVGIVQYQIVATLFAAATALVIAAIAGRMAAVAAATAAGLLYLCLLGVTGGPGGQTPVFYNLFVALAAWATLAANEPDRPIASIRRLGCSAMLLAGLAMQIKYNALFEGVFFGIMLLRRSWRAGTPPARLAADAALWIGLALLPTAAALAVFAWNGHAAAFIYANFLSIGGRSTEAAGLILTRLGKTWIALHLAVFCAVLAAVLEPWRRFARGPATFGFVMAWLGAALGGYLIFGTYFDHYALPLLVPLTIAGAPLFGHRRFGPAAAIVVLAACGTASLAQARHILAKRGGVEAAAEMVAEIKPRLTNCLYVFDGNPILYHLTGSCLPSRYAFPSHLFLTREKAGIGVDPIAEIRRILAGKPSVVVDSVIDDPDIDLAAKDIVHAELERNYRLVAEVPTSNSRTMIYQRRPGR